MTFEKHDLVIRHGMIMDGTGKPGFVADLAINDGKISAIGNNISLGNS